MLLLLLFFPHVSISLRFPTAPLTVSGFFQTPEYITCRSGQPCLNVTTHCVAGVTTTAVPDANCYFEASLDASSSWAIDVSLEGTSVLYYVSWETNSSNTKNDNNYWIGPYFPGVAGSPFYTCSATTDVEFLIRIYCYQPSCSFSVSFNTSWTQQCQPEWNGEETVTESNCDATCYKKAWKPCYYRATAQRVEDGICQAALGANPFPVSYVNCSQGSACVMGDSLGLCNSNRKCDNPCLTWDCGGSVAGSCFSDFSENLATCHCHPCYSGSHCENLSYFCLYAWFCYPFLMGITCLIWTCDCLKWRIKTFKLDPSQLESSPMLPYSPTLSSRSSIVEMGVSPSLAPTPEISALATIEEIEEEEKVLGGPPESEGSVSLKPYEGFATSTPRSLFSPLPNNNSSRENQGMSSPATSSPSRTERSLLASTVSPSSTNSNSQTASPERESRTLTADFLSPSPKEGSPLIVNRSVVRENRTSSIDSLPPSSPSGTPEDIHNRSLRGISESLMLRDDRGSSVSVFFPSSSATATPTDSPISSRVAPEAIELAAQSIAMVWTPGGSLTVEPETVRRDSGEAI